MKVKYQELIKKLRTELSTQQTPGPVLDSIMFRKLEEFGDKFEHNHELLLLGAILGDIRIDEAREAGDKDMHVQLALDYAQEIYKDYDVPKEDQEVIDETIATHHGGEQKFIESKIYKNADNFKFLEPMGCFHFFGVLYTEHNEQGLVDTVGKVILKLDEKLALTDLDEETTIEAKKLYERNVKMLEDIADYDSRK